LPADAVGLMYTCAGGFIDFGHLRTIADLTRFYFDTLCQKHLAGDLIPPPPGKAQGTILIQRDIPTDKWLDVARSIAYEESVFHEIETYWRVGVGKSQSSFSPEDLISNFLGTYLAAEAIRAGSVDGPNYDTRFTDHLEALMLQLGAVPRAASQEALDRIEGRWVSGFQLLPSYLLRRNFNVWPLHPWLVDGLAACAGSSAEFPAPDAPELAIAPDATSYYSALYQVPSGAQGAHELGASVVSLPQFDTFIDDIRRADLFEYGPEHESPAPVGRVAP
jgi:Protein of unknown function (DUF4056)